MRELWPSFQHYIRLENVRRQQHGMASQHGDSHAELDVDVDVDEHEEADVRACATVDVGVCLSMCMFTPPSPQNCLNSPVLLPSSVSLSPKPISVITNMTRHMSTVMMMVEMM